MRWFRSVGMALLGLAFIGCGSDSQDQQSREPLRLNVQLAPAYVEDPYNLAITADGGVRPYRFTLEGSLPKGLNFSDGRINGTPQEKGSFPIVVTVEDSNLSSRVQKATLLVGDTPPPRFEQIFPASEQEAPFTYIVRIRERESRGFQLQIPLKELKPTLDSLKANEGLLYVLRYDEAKGLVDIDAVFTSPKREVEAFRLNIAPLPEKKVRPQTSFAEVRVALLDRNGKAVANIPNIERTATQGKYKFSDLEAIARNWGRKAPSQTDTPAPPTAPGSAATPATPADPAATPATPTPPVEPAPTPPSPEPPAQPAQTAPAVPQTPEAPATAETPAAPTTPADQPAAPADQPTAPTTEAPTQPASPATPVSTQPATAPSPAATPPAPSPTANPPSAQPTAPATQPASPAALEGDLNGDGSVDIKDLEALRASYSWASVVGSTPANPQTQPGNRTPTPPTNPATPPTNPSSP